MHTQQGAGLQLLAKGNNAYMHLCIAYRSNLLMKLVNIIDELAVYLCHIPMSVTSDFHLVLNLFF